jgi:hypothetical protein
MNCPECGVDSMVIDSRPAKSGRAVRRRRGCKCGARWSTIEKREGPVKMSYLPGRLRETTTNGADSTQHIGPPTTTNGIAVTQLIDSKTQSVVVGKGERGLGLTSDSGSGSLFPVSDPIRISSSNSTELVSKTRARNKRRAAEYGAFFEDFWQHTGRCYGNKGTAWEAWEAIDPRPSGDAMKAAWSAYMLSRGPSNGAVQHVATWLNGRGWETDWRPAQQPVGANGVLKNAAVYDRFLQRGEP